MAAGALAAAAPQLLMRTGVSELAAPRTMFHAHAARGSPVQPSSSFAARPCRAASAAAPLNVRAASSTSSPHRRVDAPPVDCRPVTARGVAVKRFDMPPWSPACRSGPRAQRLRHPLRPVIARAHRAGEHNGAPPMSSSLVRMPRHFHRTLTVAPRLCRRARRCRQRTCRRGVLTSWRS